MNNMNWDGIRYFLAAAESGSLSAAAKLLSSNQPTVGRNIDILEKSLGVKLFKRSVKGLSLTLEGQRIYEQSQSIESSFVKLQRTLHSEKEDVNGSIRLSMPEGLSYEKLMPALPALYDEYPKLNLTINISPNTVNLTRGDADMAIRLFRPTEADLVIKKMGVMEMGLFASKRYESQFGLPNTLNELPNHRIISYSDSLAKLPENQWLVSHLNTVQPVLSSDSTLSRLQATICGVGISIQPKIFSQTQPELIELFKSEPIPAHDVWLVYHKDVRHLSRVRVVVDFLSQCLGNHLKSA